MGWDQAGNYNRVHNFSADASAGIKILASRMDAEINDIASAFTRVWTRDGQNTPTTDLPLGGRRFVNVGAPTSVSQFLRVREMIESIPIFMQDAESSADRISVSAQYFTSVSANQAPGDGTRIIVRANSNKSSAVLYLNGHSANIEFQGGPRIGPVLASGGIYEFLFSSADTAWKIQNPDQPQSVSKFGVVGDGTTDDTAALNNALASGYKRIVGDPNHTYLVSHVSTFSVNGTNYRRCLSIPASVTFDLNGATIQLAGAQNSSPVAMLADDASLMNGVIDFNRTNQTSPATGEMACVVCYDVDRIRVENIRAKNVRQYAGRFLNARNSHFINLHCEDSYGDGWSLGTSGAVSFELFDSFIDRIYAENCEGQYVGLEGNGAILTMIRCQVGSIHVKDSRSIKIQNTSDDSTFDSIIFDGDDHTYGSVNSGVKVQGDNASSVYPSRITIKSVVSRKAYGNGLYINDIESVHVLSYHGIDNGSGSGAVGADQNDIDINTTNGPGLKSVQIAQLTSDNPTAIGIRHQGSGQLEFDSWLVRNPTGIGYQDTSSGRINGRRLLVIDDQGGSATTTYAFRATGTASGRIESVETNLAHSTTQSRVGIAAANYNLEISRVFLGSANTLSGVQQLTNAATSTAVTCGHIWRDFVGGTADYLHPIIQVEPWDTSAKALSGNFGYTITDGSSGTGFTITHPSAGAADYVIWKLLGWKVVSQASS